MSFLSLPIGGGEVAYVNPHHISVIESLNASTQPRCQIFLLSGEKIEVLVAAEVVVRILNKSVEKA